jgi:hypothetical protein
VLLFICVEYLNTKIDKGISEIITTIQYNNNELQLITKQQKKLEEILNEIESNLYNLYALNKISDGNINNSYITANSYLEDMNTQIIEVNNDESVTLDIGSNDFVEIGTPYTIYRITSGVIDGVSDKFEVNMYIGEVIVEEINHDKCIARIDFIIKGESMKVGDLAKTSGR